jgi:hypothetical protein
MPGISLTEWQWYKRPAAQLEYGSLITCGDPPHGATYSPGLFFPEILNSVNGVVSNQTALEFVRECGFLGLSKGAHSLNESCLSMILFADKIRLIAEVKSLLWNYKSVDTLYFAGDEAEKWIENQKLSYFPKKLGISYGDLLEQYRGLSKHFGPKWHVHDEFEWILRVILSKARQVFSDRSKKGVYIKINSDGRPCLVFDGLFRFIEYNLLIDQSPQPKRCADPKCKQLFFPKKADQEYCPPPPGVRRSRCENRHGAELRRVGNGKKKKGSALPR